jgi:hypothetical protein
LLNPDFSLAAQGYFAYNSQADAGSTGSLGGLASIEDIEDFFSLRERDSRAVVTDKINDTPGLIPASGLNDFT